MGHVDLINIRSILIEVSITAGLSGTELLSVLVMPSGGGTTVSIVTSEEAVCPVSGAVVGNTIGLACAVVNTEIKNNISKEMKMKSHCTA